MLVTPAHGLRLELNTSVKPVEHQHPSLSSVSLSTVDAEGPAATCSWHNSFPAHTSLNGPFLLKASLAGYSVTATGKLTLQAPYLGSPHQIMGNILH